AAELLLDDVDWQHSRIRIRAQKGGKEVTLPLLEPVGEAIIGYLRHRFAQTPFREVFLSTKAPFQPLSSLAISQIIRRYMRKAGVTTPCAGSRTLRHSWAIRAHRPSLPRALPIHPCNSLQTTSSSCSGLLGTFRNPEPLPSDRLSNAIRATGRRAASA